MYDLEPYIRLSKCPMSTYSTWTYLQDHPNSETRTSRNNKIHFPTSIAAAGVRQLGPYILDCWFFCRGCWVCGATSFKVGTQCLVVSNWWASPLSCFVRDLHDWHMALSKTGLHRRYQENMPHFYGNTWFLILCNRDQSSIFSGRESWQSIISNCMWCSQGC